MNNQLDELLGSFAALGDLVRLRMLALLEAHELTVGELAKILQLPQSTVSRHLKTLSEGGWLYRRTEGTAGFYRMSLDSLGEQANELWRLTKQQAEQTPQHERDVARLSQVLGQRRTDTHSFFGRIGGEWDAMRNKLFGDRFTRQALLTLLPTEWTVADVGCGTGAATEALAPNVGEVIAVDISQSMLDAAQKRLQHLENVRFVKSDLTSIPLADDCVDAAICILVLHHIEEPSLVLAEMARILRPGGPALLVDMSEHEHESYRHTMGHRHLGFSRDRIEDLCSQVGLANVVWHPLPPEPDAQGPQLFAAVAL